MSEETHERYQLMDKDSADTLYASGLSSNAETLDALVNGALDVGGRPTAWVSARGTNASATATLRACLYRTVGGTREFLGHFDRAITADASATSQTSPSARYPAELEAFDTAGADTIEFRILDESAGTFDLLAWVC